MAHAVTVTCPRCGWKKHTTSAPSAVLAGHGGQCPGGKKTSPRRRVKWRDWRTEDTGYTSMTPGEVHALKLRQRGVG